LSKRPGSKIRSDNLGSIPTNPVDSNTDLVGCGKEVEGHVSVVKLANVIDGTKGLINGNKNSAN